MPTEREIELYYFSLWEASQISGRMSKDVIENRIHQGKIIAIKHKRRWMIRPDQISILRKSA